MRDAMFTYDGPVAKGTAYRPGDTVGVHVTIVNEGAATDTLVSVSSPIAGGGEIVGVGTLPGRHVLTAGYPQPIAFLTLPGTKPIDLRLTSLKTSIKAGLTYPVVFTFARAGQLRLQVGVENSDEPRAECLLSSDGKPKQIFTAPIGQGPMPPTTPPPDCSSLR